jgi:transcriptional regulator with XRE-family HTH domain
MRPNSGAQVLNVNGSQGSSPGQWLKTIRLRLALTLQDVEEASLRISRHLQDPRYHITASSVADLENHERIPGVHKVFALAVVYHLPVREMLRGLGIDAYKEEDYSACVKASRLTRPVDFTGGQDAWNLPIRFDPAFSTQTTTLLNRTIQQWQSIPLEFFKDMEFDKFLFARIGDRKNFLYPVLPPGSIAKVDPRLTQVINWGWKHEFERPIYLVATHDGYHCCWCQQEDRDLILVPHPLSMCCYERFRLKQEAEVMGQAVGLWMPLTPLNEAPRRP